MLTYCSLYRSKLEVKWTFNVIGLLYMCDWRRCFNRFNTFADIVIISSKWYMKLEECGLLPFLMVARINHESKGKLFAHCLLQWKLEQVYLIVSSHISWLWRWLPWLMQHFCSHCCYFYLLQENDTTRTLENVTCCHSQCW